ncbi:MAG: NlpC/P60 family protein [Treponema sp.]|nr:NlpC/P60 family protein [Treponema sp.]
MARKKHIFTVLLAAFAFCATGAGAAPLQHGFSLAPSSSASPAERDGAFVRARERLVAVARGYEGTPYLFGGTTRRGMDCSGFVYRSFRSALGVSVPRTSESMFLWTERIARHDLQPGDLVFFRTGATARITHVGIYTGTGVFIHSASAGRVTGVIHSRMDEPYWTRTYAGAGRALPGVASIEAVPAADGTEGTRRFFFRRRASGEGRTLVGFAVAPTWNTLLPENDAFRGMAGQIRIGRVLGQSAILGLELRPEWDRMLGVFRVPLTLSWGMSDRVRLFAGPALSFGDAALNVGGTSRPYTGGTSWFGTAGVTFAPFAIGIAGTEVSPYAELAWQSFSGQDAGVLADIAAGTRFSTGLRFTWRRR